MVNRQALHVESARLTTLGMRALEKLKALSTAVGAQLGPSADATLELLLGSSANSPQLSEPVRPTSLTDDGSPFEFSVAFQRGALPELRMLVERQYYPHRELTNWQAGLELHELLREQRRISTERFDQIADLFAPNRNSGEFAIWHAARLDAFESDAASYKVYLNPQIHGAARARDLIHEAMSRLGMNDAWEFLDSQFRGIENSIPLYFSLDLSTSEDARVKVYIAHRSSTSFMIDDALIGTRDYIKGDALEWTQTLLGSSGPFDDRPIIVSYAFSSRSRAIGRPTLHFPIRCYAANDEDALDRASTLLTSYGIDANQALGGLQQWAGRPLGIGRGLITYVSCRRLQNALRFTLYLAPQLYAIASPRSESTLPSAGPHSMIRELSRDQRFETMSRVRDRLEQHSEKLRMHPFLARLSTGQCDLIALRTLARKLTFFVLAFQDILRLTARVVTHPELKLLAQSHQREDKGHDLWFLSDLAKLNVVPLVSDVFSEDHRVPRDVVYELVGLLFGQVDDYSRIAVVMVLEATASEFFPRIATCVQRLGYSDSLFFFGSHHADVEAAHTSAQPAQRDQLWEMTLSKDAMTNVLATVDTAFGSMFRLASELDRSM